ncbi:MAG: RagB/SusD family nutrient uptake outer membrane protein [Bacteroidales bacterium]|nr:RagB/SusD family nutrient uptake outer membrane protein [Bacteroidales bacterium]
MKYISCLAASAMALSLCASCADLLEETPESEMTATFYETKKGLNSALTASYEGLRLLVGAYGPSIGQNAGTDEFNTNSTLGGQNALDLYSVDHNASNNYAGYAWDFGFRNANVCSAVIEYAEKSSAISEEERTNFIAEARLLRGFNYYLITMNHGAAPLDLGSGKLKYNTNPSTSSVRDPRTEVLEAVIADFEYAAQNLPDRPRETGRVAKAAALHLLAKAEVSYASLISSGQEQGNAASHYAASLKAAKQLIDNQAAYGAGLLDVYGDNFVQGNERNKENIFYIERDGFDSEYSEADQFPRPDNYATAATNFMCYFPVAGYENVRINGVQICSRDKYYGRPWRMLFPTYWLCQVAYADKVNDRRFNEAFRTEWVAEAGTNENGIYQYTTPVSQVSFTNGIQTLVTDEKGRTIKTGELAIKIDMTNSTVAEAGDYVGGNDGKCIFKPYACYNFNDLYTGNAADANGTDSPGRHKESNVWYLYPSLEKYVDHSTNQIKNSWHSARPITLARLAETYLIAAEAALGTGDKEAAAAYINVVRERAAADGIDPKVMDITASDVTLDYILDERSREMAGECWRWIDLARTGKLIERVKAHNYQGAPNIQSFHLLRPVPQSQIDAMTDPEQKKNYQNPGY